MEHLWVSSRASIAAWFLPRSIGAMGPIGKNFWADLVGMYGHEEVVARVADCYTSGRRREAAQFVTDALVDDLGLVGPAPPCC